MKLITLLGASLLMATSAMATGTGFYVGAGLGMEKVNSDNYDEDPLLGGLVKAGYIPHKNIAFEFRADRTLTAGEQLEHTYSVGFYAKPQYEFMEDWTAYGLIGYGQHSIAFPDEEKINGNPEDTSTVSGLSFGGGLEFRMSKKFSFFVEGLQVVNGSETIDGDDFEANVAGVYAGVSYYFDAKPAKVVKALPTTIKYSKTPQEINILFDSGKWDIKPQYYKELTNYANFMKNNRAAKMDIMGHTDSRSSDKYNRVLSGNRARAIKMFIARKGVSTSRIKSLGLGEGYPKATNKTAQGRAINRRIEAKIYR